MKITKRQLSQIIRESILAQDEKQKILSLLDSIVFTDRIWKKGEDNFGNPLPGGGRENAQSAYELLSSLGDPEEWISDIIEGIGDGDTREVRWKDVSRMTWMLNFLAQDRGMLDRGWKVSSGYYSVGLRYSTPDYRYPERDISVTIPKLKDLDSLAGRSYPLDLTIEANLIPWKQRMHFSIVGKLPIPHKYVKSDVGTWKEFPNTTTYLEKKFNDWYIDIPPNIKKYVSSHVHDGTSLSHGKQMTLNLEMFFNFLKETEEWINSGNFVPVTEFPGMYRKFPILGPEDEESLASLGKWEIVGGAEKFVASPNTEYERVEKGLPSKWDNIKLKY